jgi:hypothetical protein
MMKNLQPPLPKAGAPGRLHALCSAIAPLGVFSVAATEMFDVGADAVLTADASLEGEGVIETFT